MQKPSLKYYFQKRVFISCGTFFRTFAYDVGGQAVFLFIIHVLSSVMLSLLLENMLHSLRIFDCTNPIGFKELPFWMGITIFLLHTIISTENKYLFNTYKLFILLTKFWSSQFLIESNHYRIMSFLAPLYFDTKGCEVFHLT